MTEIPAAREVIAEGKTKKILAVPGTSEVDIVSKDWITAGDGARRHLLVGKGVLATTTTVNVFQLLRKAGYANHFIEHVDSVTFRARRLRMIPVEFVARRVATGSYVKRNPDVAEGTYFDQPIVELFLKDDVRHDPLMIREGGRWALYDPKLPISPTSRIGILDEHFFTQRCGADLTPELTHDRTNDTSDIFLMIERAWGRQEIVVPDYKLEYGVTPFGKVTVGDVIDNDSWRLWPHGDKHRELSKQRYRDAKAVTPEILDEILSLYAQVAGRTMLFFNDN